MKRKIVHLAKGLVFCAVLCGIGSLENYVKTSYTREAIVIEYQGNVCTAIDSSSNEWTFDGKGFQTGDKVKLYMNTNHTDNNIFDDEITKVKIIKED